MTMTKTAVIAMIVFGCTLLALAEAAAAPPAAQLAKELTLDLGNDVTLKCVLIPAGKFIMGNPQDKANAVQHEVTITKPFYMGTCEVTQGQFLQIMGSNPSADMVLQGTNPMKFKPDMTLPVQMVTWLESVYFCRKLSAKTGKTVRLPTEAEWEYAARAGTTTTWSFGDDVEEASDHAWIWLNCFGHQTHPVGLLKPNPWGLYDVHGNLGELCSDWYVPSFDAKPAVDPQGPDEPVVGPNTGYDPTHLKLWRSGSYYAGNCEMFIRGSYPFDLRKPNVGFRVAVNAE